VKKEYYASLSSTILYAETLRVMDACSWRKTGGGVDVVAGRI
jgi:hypothetical protein